MRARAEPDEDELYHRVLYAVLYDDMAALRAALDAAPEEGDADAYDDFIGRYDLVDKALTAACRYGNLEHAQALVDEYDALPGFNALTAAVLNGQARVFEFLVSAGADPHECDTFGIYDVECTRLLLEAGVAVDPKNLVEAVHYEWFDLLCFLLDRGVDACRAEALALATQRNMPEYIQRLQAAA